MIFYKYINKSFVCAKNVKSKINQKLIQKERIQLFLKLIILNKFKNFIKTKRHFFNNATSCFNFNFFLIKKFLVNNSEFINISQKISKIYDLVSFIRIMLYYDFDKVILNYKYKFNSIISD